MSENLISEPVSLKRGGYDKGYASDASAGFQTISLDCPEVLKFPEDGLVTFRFKRGQIVARSATRSQGASASCTLELTKLCSVEEAEPEENEDAGDDYRDSPIDKLFEQAQGAEPEEEE